MFIITAHEQVAPAASGSRPTGKVRLVQSFGRIFYGVQKCVAVCFTCHAGNGRTHNPLFKGAQVFVHKGRALQPATHGYVVFGIQQVGNGVAVGVSQIKGANTASVFKRIHQNVWNTLQSFQNYLLHFRNRLVVLSPICNPKVNSCAHCHKRGGRQRSRFQTVGNCLRLVVAVAFRTRSAENYRTWNGAFAKYKRPCALHCV